MQHSALCGRSVWQPAGLFSTIMNDLFIPRTGLATGVISLISNIIAVDSNFNMLLDRCSNELHYQISCEVTIIPH